MFYIKNNTIHYTHENVSDYDLYLQEGTYRIYWDNADDIVFESIRTNRRYGTFFNTKEFTTVLNNYRDKEILKKIPQ